MANYDPQNLESVLLYMRGEFGADVFKDSERMYALICGLSPKLKPYANIMRQLAEGGALAAWDAAPRREEAVRETRRVLEEELLLSEDRADYFLGVLQAAYDATPSAPSSAQDKPKPQAEHTPSRQETPSAPAPAIRP